MATSDVVIAGGGVIGTAIAWRAAMAGLGVTVVDPGRGDAASLVAAGMLAPVSEALFGEEELLALNLLAIRRFPGFVAELEEKAGCQAGLRREGTLAVAYDRDDQAALTRLTGMRGGAGLAAEGLDGPACRKIEPFLAPGVTGGVLFSSDWSVDNRRYAAALNRAAQIAGVKAIRGEVVEVRDGNPQQARLSDGSTLECGAVVVAAGSWSGAIDGLPDEVGAAVRPVKGQLLRLRLPAGVPPVLTHTVRGLVRGADVYLVPRAGGELVVGATSEERGHDLTVTAGAVHDLLRDAMNVLPVLTELVLAETCAGLRPATPDNGPVVGHAGGLLVATGHYRNGILLSAATADAVTAFLTGQRPAPEWEPFSPERFTTEVER